MKRKKILLLIFLILVSMLFNGCSQGDNKPVNNDKDIQQSEKEGNNQELQNEQHGNEEQEEDKEQNKNNSTDNDSIIYADYLLDYMGKSTEEVSNSLGEADYEDFDSNGGYFLSYFGDQGYSFQFTENLDMGVINQVSIESMETSTTTVSLYDIEIGSSDLSSLESRFEPHIIEQKENGYTINTYQDEKYIIECQVTGEGIISLIKIISLDLSNNNKSLGLVNSLDSDILYHYMDGDADFLFMKLGELPLIESGRGKYYELNYNHAYRTLYWLAEDNYTINRISVVKNLEYYNSDEGDPSAEGYLMRFMGIWLDMTMEEAARNITNIPTWNREQFDLRVEYSDYQGDGKVYRIDVYSNKDVNINVHKEDFYLKWFGCNIEEEADHLGFGPFDTPTPAIYENNRMYSYEMVFGPDKWTKNYYYDENKSITSVEIRTEVGSEFEATVPSILGIQLNMDADDIDEVIENANNAIYSQSIEGEFTTTVYFCEDVNTSIPYFAKVSVHEPSNLVKKVEISLRPLVQISEDYSLGFIGEDISDVEDQLFRGGSEEIDTLNRIYRTKYDFVDSGDKWIKEYYYDDTNTISKIKLSLGTNGQTSKYVPSLFGITLNMDQRVLANTIKSNNYSIGGEDALIDSDDGKYSIKKYMIYHNETNYGYNIVIAISNATELVNSIEVYPWAP